MRKWVIKLIPLIVIFVLVSYGFTTIDSYGEDYVVPSSLKMKEPTEVLFPKSKTVIELLPTTKVIAPPFLGTCFVGFKEALAFKESQGDYFVTNTLGYLGKYQFGETTLKLMGVHNTDNFLKNPVLQEEVFYINLSRNKWILRKDIERHVGRTISGHQITESGILAAAHLAGAGNVKRFLRSRGNNNVKDAYGTSLLYYMKRFSGYDVSSVLPVKNAKI